MQVIKNENVVFTDIDGTLVLPDLPEYGNLPPVKIPDPLEPSRLIDMRIHDAMVRIIKEEHSKGFYIIAWSKGGNEWARTVIVALKLEKYVSLIMTKPSVYLDDIAVDKWLPYRVYLEPGTKYKT